MSNIETKYTEHHKITGLDDDLQTDTPSPKSKTASKIRAKTASKTREKTASKTREKTSSKTGSNTESKTKSDIIVISARGKGIKVRFNVVECSNTINTWFHSLCEERKKKKPRMLVNFSRAYIHKFLDFVSHDIYEEADSKKLALMCSYFGVKSDIGMECTITIRDIALTSSEVYISITHRYCKPMFLPKDEHKEDSFLFGFNFTLNKKKNKIIKLERVCSPDYSSFFDASRADDAIYVDDERINEIVKESVVAPHASLLVPDKNKTKEGQEFSEKGKKTLEQIASIIIQTYMKDM